jgi:DNA invertase Pin-like site-specific DNA recombinase
LNTQEQYVTYFRVSTERQGTSGLGLEAQKNAVGLYIARTGGEVLAEFVEVESGRKSDRPQLAAAIAKAKKIGAVLLIAKLDRLARRVHFISGLMETGVQFRAADMPSADRFMLHVYAAMAEEEARRIGERTKAALQAAKARGVKLGTSCKILAAANQRQAAAHAEKIGPIIADLKESGQTIRDIAARLNSDNVPSYSGGTWHPTTVQRVWSRYHHLTTGKFTTPLC